MAGSAQASPRTWGTLPPRPAARQLRSGGGEDVIG